MQATATSKERTIAGQLLTGRAVEKRRSSNSDARPSTCISSKVAPSSLSIARYNLNESEAIRRAQGGDPLMFEHLYRLHSRRVYALCLRTAGNTTEAEDLTQEVFLLLLRKIHTFRGDSAFSTWLHRLTVNLVLMHLRRKSLPVVSIEQNLDPDQNNLCPARYRGVPTQRDCRNSRTLDRCIEIAVTQGAHAAARTASRVQPAKGPR